MVTWDEFWYNVAQLNSSSYVRKKKDQSIHVTYVDFDKFYGN